MSADHALVGFGGDREPRGSGQSDGVVNFAQVGHFPSHEPGVLGPDFRKVHDPRGRGGAGNPFQPAGQLVGDGLIAFGQFWIVVVRNGVQAFHHAVDIHGGSQDLLLHPRRMRKGVARAALLQFVHNGQEVVVGREKAAELDVVRPEPGELGFLIDLASGVEADEIEEQQNAFLGTPHRAAHLFFEPTPVRNDAHPKLQCSLFYLC